MFVYSVKSNQIRFFLIVLFIIVSIAAIVILAKNGNVESAAAVKPSLDASTEEERLAFLGGFGWQADKGSEEVTEVIIPEEFDEVYLSYNELQKQQGFDLQDYAGKRVKRWTYTVTNYPGYENKPCIRANILVLDGKVIGGDICSVELDGFMHAFDMNKNEQPTT